MSEWFAGGRTPRTLTVVGGSSPFTLSMVAAFLDGPPWPDGRLVLQGRDAGLIDDIGRCAAAALEPLGWRVRATTDLAESLDGTDVVLHQNRYGGLAWREQDELLASRFGLGPEETIGPAGLAVSLRTGHGQEPYAAAFAALGGDVPVLTMTNPLGVSTAHFAAAGVPTLGICELPEMTRLDLAAAAGLDPDGLSASYTGLNHRGFWHHATHDGRDVLGPLAERLARSGETLHGATADEIDSFRAYPDKYRELFRSGIFLTPGRSRSLDALRTTIREEAAADPGRLPPSLAGRDMPWHRIIVMPVLRALAGVPADVVVTRTEPDGVAVERRVTLCGNTIEDLPNEAPPAAVADWFGRFRAAEAATVAAVASPTPQTVAAALALDPYVPPAVVDAAAAAVLEDFHRWRAAEGRS